MNEIKDFVSIERLESQMLSGTVSKEHSVTMTVEELTKRVCRPGFLL